MAEKEKRCQVEMREGCKCGRELFDEEYCIFHSQNPNKNVSLLQEILNEIFKDKSLKIYDFTRFIFPEQIVFPKLIEKPMFFEFGVIQGTAPFLGVIFKNPTHFGGTRFQGLADFRDVIFEKEATFGGCKFLGLANFLGTTFMNDVSFSSAIFHDEALFRSATFHGQSWFGASKFMGIANFYNTLFKGYTYFADVVFQSIISFLLTRFEGEVAFYHAIFKDRTSFISTVFKKKVHFLGTTFEKGLIISGEENNKNSFEEEVDFREVKFLRPEISTLYKVNLSKTRFLWTDLRKVQLVDVNWCRGKSRGRNKIFDEASPDPETKNFDYPLIAQVYKRLRANYEENLNYAEAGDFHIGEMEMRRKGEKNPFNKAVIWLYKLISNYGESYWRPLGWIALLLLVFPFLYTFAGIVQYTQIDGSQSVEKLKDYWSSFTYSLSVFSLVRERPYHTINNLGHFFAILESIFSPVLIAFFLLALRRRFKR